MGATTCTDTPRGTTPTSARGSRVLGSEPRLVTFALLDLVYDAVPASTRERLWHPGGRWTRWYAQGPRIESESVLVGSPWHRSLEALAPEVGMVQLAIDAARCDRCGCVEAFGCAGGCGWLPGPYLRCTSCLGRAPVPRRQLPQLALSDGRMHWGERAPGRRGGSRG